MSGIPIAARRGSAIGLAVLLACGAPGLVHAESDTGLAVTTGVSLPAQAQGKPPAWSGKAYRQGVELKPIIVRKEPKKHGTMSYVEGPALPQGSAVAVVEDVVTSGASLLRAMERIEAAGYRPVQALAILDRQEGGREAIKERGFDLQALFARRELGLDRK